MRYDILALCPCVEPGRLPWNEHSVLVEDVDECLDKLKPSISLSLENTVDADHVLLTFQRFKDFKPQCIIDQLPETSRETPVEKKSSGKDSNQEDDTLGGLFAMVDVPGQETASAVPRGADQGKGFLLQRLFNDPEFCAVERSWQAIRRLKGSVCRPGKVALRVLPTAPEHLDHTLELLGEEVDRVLPSLLLVDILLKASSRDIALLERLADFAATFSLPILTGLSSVFFGINDWSKLERLSYLPHHLEQPQYTKWRKTAAASDLIHLSANEFLLRPSYGGDTPVKGINLHESEPSWINPAWAAAEIIGHSVAATGMPTRLTGMPAALHDLHPGNTVHGKAVATRGMPSHDKVEQAATAGINLLAPVVDRDSALFLNARSASGYPFAGRLFACHVARVLNLARDTFLGESKPEAIRSHVHTVFNTFWSESGGTPDAWRLELQPTEGGDALTVMVSVTPPPEMCPGCEPVRLETVFNLS